jgi:hypothetical protein
MDGLEATLQIRQDPRFAALPIIAMTARPPEQRQTCIESGMNDHVAKPIVPEVLFDAILRHTRRKPAASPALPLLPGLDVASALRRMNNKPDTYLSLLRRFVASHADCAGHIDTALAAGQLKDAERLAHTLRGTPPTSAPMPCATRRAPRNHAAPGRHPDGGSASGHPARRRTGRAHHDARRRTPRPTGR